jgi:predicted acetyltransferase
MPTVTIRQLSPEEASEVMYPLTSYSFSPSPPLRDKAEFMASARLRRGATCVAAFEDDLPVAVVAATAMAQNVRGALFGSSAIWGVASHPAARRQGYVRKSMAVLLALTREAGMVTSALYPFRESFYERMGYVNSARPHIAKFAPAELAPLLKHDLGGHVEWLSIADGYDVYRDYVIRVRQRTHGMAVFDQPEKEEAIRRNDSWVALAKVGGETVGAMLYNLRHEGGHGMTLKAHRFYSDTSQGRYLLLQWIARHADQAGQAELRLRPTELPETWFPDLRVTVEFVWGPMARIVDVMGIQGMPVGGCAADGHEADGFTAYLTDALCPWNEGRWRFEAVDGRLRVSRTDEAHCELTIQGLTGLVFGTHSAADFAFRGWGQPALPVQEAIHALFAPAPPPYLHETF